MTKTLFTSAAISLVISLAAGTAVLAQSPSEVQPDALTEVFRDWVVRCVPGQDAAAGLPADAASTPQAEEAAGNTRFCEMSQELRQRDTNQRVMTLALQKGEAGESAALVMILPFGLNLADGVTIAVDGTDVQVLPFDTCLPAGCLVEAQLDPQQVADLITGQAAVIKLTARDGTPFDITASLAGFTAAWGRLNQL